MKGLTRVICILLCLSLMYPTYSPMIVNAESSVDILSDMGLLSNTKSSELSTRLNRLVGLTMMLKAMGYTDTDVNKVSNSSAFVDLKGDYAWGIGWVNIGVEKNIAMGTSYNTFSPGNTLTKKEFVAYTLRLLGYGIDESYAECDTLAIEAGLIDSKSELTDSYFTKQDAVEVLHAALSAKLKNKGNKTLIEQMIDDGIVSEDVAIEYEIEGSNKLAVESIEALSNTYLLINLGEPVEYVSTNDFELEDYYGDEVEMESVELYNNGYTIVLETDEQDEEIQHTLTIENEEYTYESLEEEDVKPRLIDVDVLTNTSIRLTFNEPMSAKAIDEDYYSINKLSVKSAEYELVEIKNEEEDEALAYEWEDEDDEDDENENEEDDKEFELVMSNIILTTSKQTKKRRYNVDVDKVTDLSYNKINSSYDDEYFYGANSDSDDLELEQATAISPTRVKLTFSEDLDEDSAEDEDNYEIDGLTIKKAILDNDDPDTVYLITSEQREDYKYKVEVSHVEDLDGQSIDSSEDTDTFYGSEEDEDGPRLIEVTSISNTQVEVAFNESILSSTALMEYAYYFGEELGYALDVNIDEDEEDGTVWIITTMPQFDQEYTLTVRGLKDLEGNFIDEDYAEETFTGTP